MQGLRPFNPVHPERRRRADGKTQDKTRPLLRRCILPACGERSRTVLSGVEGSGRLRRADVSRRSPA
jgi:hypothetical protein